MSINKFLNKYKLKKSSSKQNLFKTGDIINLYNNEYEVCSDLGTIAILKDEKGFKFQIPSNALNQVLEKGNANFTKAVTPKTGNPKAFPIGTVHNGRKKIAEGVWVNVNTGATHSSHEGEDRTNIKNLMAPDQIKHLKDVVTKIRTKIEGEENKKKAITLLKDFVTAKVELSQLKSHLDSEAKNRQLKEFERSRFNNKMDSTKATYKRLVETLNSSKKKGK